MKKMKKIYAILSILICCSLGTIKAQNQVFEAQISASPDDAEERNDNRLFYFGSSDLELGAELDAGYNQQILGLRFPEVTIPQGATIVDAKVQFVCRGNSAYPDVPNANPSNITITYEEVDSSWTATVGDETVTDILHNKINSTASVAWSIPEWVAKNDALPAQLTPDLKILIQEIVNRAGWKSGNALCLLFKGSGSRRAYAYDDNPDLAPKITINYTTTTGIHFAKAGKLEIYPNPVSGKQIQVNLNGLDITSNANISLLDITGKIVYSQNVGKSRIISIPIETQKSGIYMIKAVSNNKVLMSKVVIE